MVTTVDEQRVWIEVKAQTTKAFYSELVQSDWIRDDTDFLRLLVVESSTFRAHLPPAAVAQLSSTVDDQWTAESLWLADIALLTNGRARLRAGVRRPEDLQDFLCRKYCFQLSQEGARLFPLTRLVPVDRVLSGEAVSLAVGRGGKAAARVTVSAGQQPGHGTTHFTYYVAYGSGVLGRHKLHAAALPTS